LGLGLDPNAQAGGIGFANAPTLATRYFNFGDGPATVKKFDGTNWVNAGSAGFFSQMVLTWQGDPAILARSQLTDTLTGKVINPADPQWAKGYPVTLTTSVRHFTWNYLGR